MAPETFERSPVNIDDARMNANRERRQEALGGLRHRPEGQLEGDGVFFREAQQLAALVDECAQALRRSADEPDRAARALGELARMLADIKRTERGAGLAQLAQAEREFNEIEGRRIAAKYGTATKDQSRPESEAGKDRQAA